MVHLQPQRAASAAPNAQTPELIRGVGLGGATALNMIDMIGVGPFITIPLIVSAAGGPQAMLGWICGAAFAMCDGMVWAELGATMPRSGGSYRYLNEIYGPNRLGRLVSFLFIWQLSFSAPLSIASGCIGLAQYAAYFWPELEHPYVARGPLLITPGSFVAIGICMVAVWLLYRGISGVERLSKLLWVGVMGTIAWIIIAGLTHFSAARAFSFPPGAFTFSSKFLTGMGAGLLIAAYDYWGYYNVCFIGAEVKEPARTIPRAVLLSILFVSCIYVVMNISILGVVPWQEMLQAAKSDTHFYVASTFMERLYGHTAGYIVTALIIWTAFASVFSLLLGYSRVPYAAALDGNYFKVFARVHPQYRIPHVALLTLGAAAMLFCLFRLVDVIAALVVIRIMIQFLIQAVGLIILRIQRPDIPRPFRMWLYPVPVLVACFGFVFILVARPHFLTEIRYALVILAAGITIYLLRARRRREWPFGAALAS